MSFIKTLATLAIGFAAARGVDRYRKMGGMDGVRDTLKQAGAPGGMADNLGAMAEKMGLPGGAQAVRDMAKQAGATAEASIAAAETGWGNFMKMAAGAAGSAGQAMSDLTDRMGGSAGAMSEANAMLLIRTMIEAAKADGAIDAEEKAKIMAFLTDASPDEKAFVEQAMAAPADMAGLLASVPEEMKARVYQTSLMVLHVDNDAERAYLDQLATALGLDAATRADLEGMV